MRRRSTLPSEIMHSLPQPLLQHFSGAGQSLSLAQVALHEDEFGSTNGQSWVTFAFLHIWKHSKVREFLILRLMSSRIPPACRPTANHRSSKLQGHRKCAINAGLLLKRRNWRFISSYTNGQNQSNIKLENNKVNMKIYGFLLEFATDLWV